MLIHLLLLIVVVMMVLVILRIVVLMMMVRSVSRWWCRDRSRRKSGRRVQRG